MRFIRDSTMKLFFWHSVIINNKLLSLVIKIFCWIFFNTRGWERVCLHGLKGIHTFFYDFSPIFHFPIIIVNFFNWFVIINAANFSFIIINGHCNSHCSLFVYFSFIFSLCLICHSPFDTFHYRPLIVQLDSACGLMNIIT